MLLTIAGTLADVDALENTSTEFHWCWELRALSSLPKHMRGAADAARKHRRGALERLRAVSAYVALAQAHDAARPGKAADTKLARAAAKLAKHLPAEALRAGRDAAAAATAEALAQAAAAEQVRQTTQHLWRHRLHYSCHALWWRVAPAHLCVCVCVCVCTV
jgi:hypothetical protein